MVLLKVCPRGRRDLKPTTLDLPGETDLGTIQDLVAAFSDVSLEDVHLFARISKV